MRILSLEGCYFVNPLREMGHVVLSVGVGPEHDLPLTRPLWLHELWQLLQSKGFVPDAAVWGDACRPPCIVGLERLPVPLVGYSVDQYMHPWHMPYSAAFDHVYVAQKDYLPLFERPALARRAEWMPLFAHAPDQEAGHSSDFEAGQAPSPASDHASDLETGPISGSERGQTFDLAPSQASSLALDQTSVPASGQASGLALGQRFGLAPDQMSGQRSGQTSCKMSDKTFDQAHDPDHAWSAARDIPVCFVGTVRGAVNRARADFLRRFKAVHPLVVVQGNWGPIYARSRIVLNQSAAGEVNLRVFEAASRGAAVLTEDVDNGLRELFTPGEEILVYPRGHAETAARVAAEALADPDRLAAVAEAGRKRFLAEHSSVVRTRTLLRRIRGLRAGQAWRKRLENMAEVERETASAYVFLGADQPLGLPPELAKFYAELGVRYQRAGLA